MLDCLQEAFERLGGFSADIAHELRTPLTNLRSAAEVALRQARSPDEYRDVLESALEEYARLTEMIDRLLFLARADTGAAALARERVDLRAEIEATCDYFAPLAEDAGVTLVPAGDVTVDADPQLVRRALGNLVANAIAHTPAGGRITVSAEPSDGRAVVRVADTGVGIAPEHLPHVFSRFYRVWDSRASGRPGTGLGLAIVRSITELHGGSAAIESRPGVGTTVTLTFPIVAPSEMTAR